MVALPNTKIDSTMIEEFSSPIFEQRNHNKYMYVSEDGQVIYKTITDIIDEINEDGGIIGTNNKVVIRDWEPNYEYREMETVTYNNAIWKCTAYRSQKATFDYDDWKMLAGYSKTSQFFYDAENPITEIVLEEEVPSKGSFLIDVNNLLLQSNNYSLGDDHKTITFVNPIPKDTQIEVTVYGNMIFPTDINNVVVKSFTATADGETEFFLDESIMRKEFAFVNVDNSDLLQSEWDLNNAHDTIILHTPVNAGSKVQVQYFNNIMLSVGGTFIPTVTKVGTTVTISWTNDKGLPNPEPVEWYDGVTFTPSTSKSDYISTISWSNDGGRQNPETLYVYDGVIWTPHINKVGTLTTLSWTNNQQQENPPSVGIYDGATFTPHVSKVDYTTTLSWTNDDNLPNPSNVDIYDGVIWTPSQTKSGRMYTVSWTNNQGKQNPQDVNMWDGVTFTPSVSTDEVTQTATISWSNDGSLPNPQNITLYLGNDNTTQRHVETFTATANQTQFVASQEIIDKEVLSVNIDNTELTSGAYSLGADHKTVTIIDPVEEGAIVELKYFHNLVMISGATYTPHLTRTGNYTEISWTNDGQLPNPEPVDIYDGAVYTPVVTEGTAETTISWTNDGGLPNPEPVSIFTNYAQRIVETFTATANQTTFVVSNDIYNKDVLSVNVANTELTASAYTLGADHRTVTLLSGVSEGTLVDIKYFHNIMVGTEGPHFTPTITEVSDGTYELSWTNNGGLPNPQTITITSIKNLGIWSSSSNYYSGNFVTYEDTNYYYGYIAKQNVPAGTSLSNTAYWTLAYNVAKQYIAATIIDWEE